MLRLRIGLAEDSPDQRWAIKSLLRALGHDVVCEAADGKSLVDAVSQAQVDLVITDFDMPVLDGLEAAEEITRKLNVPIILLSGHFDAKQLVLEHEPVTVAMQKPVSAESLRQAIERAWQIGNSAR
jgi:CheY-like chemotaxis protein